MRALARGVISCSSTTAGSSSTPMACRTVATIAGRHMRSITCSGTWAALPNRQCLGVMSPARGFAASAEGEKKEGDSSDKRHEETGEYDTQDANRRVGNPISWANPTGGPGIEDNSSNRWRYIFPLGIAGILGLCLWSRQRSLAREREEDMVGSPNINFSDSNEGYQTPSRPAYQPPPPPPRAPSSDGGSQFWSSSSPPSSQEQVTDTGFFSSPPSSR